MVRSFAFGLLATAISAAAHDISKGADLDSSVWAALDGIKARTATHSTADSHISKRQSSFNPPAELATPLEEVWDHCLATYSQGLFGFENYGWDQLWATQGSINVCVRWDSSETVTKAQRDKLATVYAAQYQKWFEWLYGFDGFPFSKVDVNVVGWAVRDKALLQGSTDGLDVYTDVDGEGVPQCSPSCGRFFHQDNDYSSCPGGQARHYDQSFWLTDGMQGGAGGDWGQRIGSEYFLQAMDSEDVHILLHEMGHTYGLDDFYDWTPTGITNFIMLAGSSAKITDFDGWMLRNWWTELSRKRGWQGVAIASSAIVEQDKSTTLQTRTRTTTTQTTAAAISTSKPVATSPGKTTKTAVNQPTQTAGTGSGSSPVAQKWQQCGGQGWTGPTACAAGTTCTKQNDWYSQCL